MNSPFEKLIITVEELQSQGNSYNSSMTELVVQGRRFHKHLSLGKLFKQICIQHCQKQGQMCFLVEEDTCFTIWQESSPNPSRQKVNTQANPSQPYRRTRPLNYNDIKAEFRRSGATPGHQPQSSSRSSPSGRASQFSNVQSKAAPTHQHSPMQPDSKEQTAQPADVSLPFLAKQPTPAEKNSPQLTQHQRVYRGITYPISPGKNTSPPSSPKQPAHPEKDASQTAQSQRIYRGISY
ncbi:hypothetical protein C7B61_03065 [filamentous cyanobacterium CCP1]|nr:hypothetical protein C7B76_04520 [filamentous cyanobacterium CCP2]PSB68031.1 hypothetical protein C7B61_03065 [filamentous cyanobacterium CCP1]